jgi:transposase
MAVYKSTHKGQGTLFVNVDLNKQLLPGSFEFALNHIVNTLDISCFDPSYQNDETGAPAYSPEVLLKIVFYCYSKGIISSRKIQAMCEDNIILKALSGDTVPHFTTIASFVSTNEEAIKEVFSQVLLNCSELGLIQGDMFAIDGCKLPSNASKEWPGTIEDFKEKKNDLEAFARKLVTQHQHKDKKERKKNLKGDHAVLPEETKKQYKKHIERLEKKIAYVTHFLETNGEKPRIGSGGEEVQSNITDNESAKIKGSHGYVQGYNGLAAADSKNQIIVAAGAVGSGPEAEFFPEMLNLIETSMEMITGEEESLKNKIVLADTGYFSENNLADADGREIEAIIPDQDFRNRDPQFDGRPCHKGEKRFDVTDFTHQEADNSYICPYGKKLVYKGIVQLNRNKGHKWQAKYSFCRECPMRDSCIRGRGGKKSFRTLYVIIREGDENFAQKMRDKIDKVEYRNVYGKRMQIIEPVFADITYCKRMNRFTLRTKQKVNTQWLLFCTVHNIGKCVPVLGEKYAS